MLSIVFALLVVWKGAARTINPRRLLIDLEVAFAGAAVWILVSAPEWTWVTPIVLIVMTVVLLDAARIAARPADDSAPPWLTVLTSCPRRCLRGRGNGSGLPELGSRDRVPTSLNRSHWAGRWPFSSRAPGRAGRHRSLSLIHI